MNNNIDEELKKKIEKREKFDMILAYVLIGVLLVCMFIVLFVKFGKESSEEEVKVSYISASDITNLFNNSDFVKKETTGGAALKATNLDNSIVIDYVKDNINLNYNISLVGSELKFDYTNLASDGEKKFIDKLYKEIAIIICKYYDNSELNCRDTISNVNENNQIDGIRYTKLGNNNIVYVNARKSVPVINKLLFNGSNHIDINTDNYILNINSYQISSAKLEITDKNVKLNGKLLNKENIKENKTIILNLFDKDNNNIAKGKYVFDENNKIKETNDFNIIINYNDNFSKDSINSYNFEIV